MSRKAPPKQTTTLENLTEWVKSVQAHHPDKIKHVSDDALLGLQTLHTAVVREIMHTAVEIEEEEREAAEPTKKRRMAARILDQAHEELGLQNEWQQALQMQSVKPKSDNPTTKMTKAQRKKARKVIDPKLIEQQELMLQKSRERALQQK